MPNIVIVLLDLFRASSDPSFGIEARNGTIVGFFLKKHCHNLDATRQMGNLIKFISR
jgi:hypothetical protein